jgi:hypothetical protein
MAISSETDALLAKGRSLIEETKRLAASQEGIRTTLKARDAALRAQPDRNSAMLSVCVFQEGLRFGWMLSAPSKDVLGRGTAETERQARIDALQAGMTYIDHANDLH